MGYTHYYYKTKATPDAQWGEFIGIVKALYEKFDPEKEIVGDSMGQVDSSPRIDKEHVVFNGLADHHGETFFIAKDTGATENNEKGFNFCKTRQMPYDTLVVACLYAAEAVGVIDKWTSDGDDFSLYEGRRLYKSVVCDKDTARVLGEGAQRRYLETGGARCPFCGNGLIDGHQVEVEAGSAYQEVTCPECGEAWKDCYTLTSIDHASLLSKEPEKDTVKAKVEEFLQQPELYEDEPRQCDSLMYRYKRDELVDRLTAFVKTFI
jgi:hypothetical protein